jgi:intein-encoded DNA endonuclease-like protein
MKKIIFTKKQQKQIIKLYDHKQGGNKIAKLFNVSKATIIRFLKEKSIPIKIKKYFCDVDFFNKINTEEKAYWLGFLYADGCVRKRNYLTYEVKLKLSFKDKKHIELFKKSIKSTNHVRDGFDKYKYLDTIKKTKISWLSLYDKKLALDLIKQGCFPKKSLILKFPTNKQVPNNLIHHFIRGYFDGDGCAFTDGKYQKMIYFCSGSSIFLQQLKDNLNFLKNPRFRQKNNNIYRLVVTNFTDIRQLYNYLYTDANIYLKRKKQIIEKIIHT